MVFNKTVRLSEGLIVCRKSVELNPENAFNFDIVEPHKKKQGNITMAKKKGCV